MLIASQMACALVIVGALLGFLGLNERLQKSSEQRSLSSQNALEKSLVIDNKLHPQVTSYFYSNRAILIFV